MQLKNKNQIFFLGSVVLLLLGLLGIVIYLVIVNKKGEPTLFLKQIYSSDYEIKPLGKNYFTGTYSDTLEVIIDSKGMEVAKVDGKFIWNGYYEMVNDSFLIYGIEGNNLITYLFDENGLRFYQLWEAYTELKPIFYKDIDRDYLIGFIRNGEEKHLYILEGNRDLIINDVTLVADKFDGKAYYTFNKNYLIFQDQNNLTGVLDTEGRQVIDYNYSNILLTKHDYFIAIDKKGNYGVIGKDRDILIPFNYKGIIAFQDFMVVINKHNKMALFNKEMENVSDFKMNYSNIVKLSQKNNVSSVKIWQHGEDFLIVNNNEEDKNKTEYEFHNLYFLKNGQVKKGIVQYGFAVGDFIYSYDDKYYVTFYDDDLKVNRKLQLKTGDIKYLQEISYVNDELIKVSYLDKTDLTKIVYYDKENKEVDFSYGNLVKRNNDYLVYLKKENEENVLTITDLGGRVVKAERAKQIDVIDDYIIIDKAIYQIMVK